MKNTFLFLIGCIFLLCSAFYTKSNTEPSTDVCKTSSTPPTVYSIRLPKLEESSKSEKDEIITYLFDELHKKEEKLKITSSQNIYSRKAKMEVRVWNGFSLNGVRGIIISYYDNNQYSAHYFDKDDILHNLTMNRNTKFIDLKKFIETTELWRSDDLSKLETIPVSPDSEYLIIELISDGKRTSKIFPNIVNKANNPDFYVGIDFCNQISKIFATALGCKYIQS